MTSDITLDELLADLRKAEEQSIPEGYYSCQEWAARWNRSMNWTQSLIRRAIQAGLMESMNAYGYRSDGIRCLRPVYRLKRSDNLS